MYIDKEKIRKIRREKDFSQEYMAESLGLSQSQYFRIENGECSIDLEKINSISEVLGINPLDIIEFSEKQVFSNCSQSGNLNTIYNQDNFENERAYLMQIQDLKEEIQFLRKLAEGK